MITIKLAAKVRQQIMTVAAKKVAQPPNIDVGGMVAPISFHGREITCTEVSKHEEDS